MSTTFFVVMQKRGDGRVFADLHKCLPEMFLTPEDAQAALDADPLLAPHRHVVEMVAMTASEYAMHLDDLDRGLSHALLVNAYYPIVQATAEVGHWGPGGCHAKMSRAEIREWARRVLAETNET